IAKTRAQQPKLPATFRGRKAALQVGVSRICFHCPQRRVVPCVITEQRLCSRTFVCSGKREFAPSDLRCCTQRLCLVRGNHQQPHPLASAHHFLDRAKERRS